MTKPPADDPPRPRGRPRVDDPMTPISSRLPSGTYDRLVREAQHQDKSVSSLVRQLLTLRLPR